ncbi:MAM and LDL-receptor class A domain-containing protein 1-like [Lytechinus variegatus]|uniref:MAM and LDL-receptor class A domain-containing protein 1-like n=1 Tax=Lytechinus variegatus TaxID=7654 RepID=UPI001BB19D19|nr:MAM and LDL-receptor class A domain-containing protein 1-like [Lytechinus variegatus]
MLKFGTCTFEDEFCEWVNVEGDDGDWLVFQGPADVGGITGPNVDHTLGTDQGHYLLVDSDQLYFPGYSALLHLGEPHLRGMQCLRFWYMMNGRNVGELMVYATDGSPLSASHVVWMLSGKQQDDGNTWLNAAVSIDFDAYSDVYIKGMIIESPYGDIAIDDLALEGGSCDFYPPEASPDYTFKPLSCDFEDDICSWTNDQSDDFDWRRGRSGDSGWGTGPSQDHTSGTGYYLYTQSGNHYYESARLISPVQDGRTEPVICLQMWYNMNGENMGSLKIKWRGENDDSDGGTLWMREGNTGDFWQIANVDFYPPKDLFEFQIEGTIGDNIFSDMAIDDISAYLGPCPATRECNFRYDMCGWMQETVLDDFDWSRGTGFDYPQPGMNLPDHSLGTPNGYFIYANHSEMVSEEDRAILYSKEIPATSEGDCMTFWYHHKGLSTLRVWERVGNTLIGPYWETQPGGLFNDWMMDRVTLKATSSFKVAFEAVIGPTLDGEDGEIAIDDVNLEIGPCVARGFCDFEDDTCLWDNVYGGDDLNWYRNQGGTDTSNTGPDVDHTTGRYQGWYMLFPVGFEAEGRKAWFVSEPQPPTQGGCFQFWYHMYGEHIGELNVYAEDLISEIRGLEWNMTGNQGNQWIKGQINLNQVTGFSIIFEGVVGTGSTGDIAIDDVFFMPDQTCNASTAPCTPFLSSSIQHLQHLVHHSFHLPYSIYSTLYTIPFIFHTASPAPYTSPVNCDFEEDWCDYSQDDSEDFDWSRMQGTSQPDDKYPKIDHTLGDGTGWYIYIDTSSQSTGDIARILTPLQPVTSQQCLIVWYHMFGASLETLNIYLRRNDANDSYVGDLVWTTQGDRADQWIEAQISVAEAVPYQVVFEGRVGSAYTGDISLDDISMIHGYCPGTPGCDFEDPFLCGYSQDSIDDDIDWMYWQGSTPTPNTGPSFDVTYGTQAGKSFIFFKLATTVFPF